MRKVLPGSKQPTATADSCQALLQRAMQAHQSSHWEHAETLYGQILTVMPNHADALHLLGLLRHQQGDSVAGERLIRRAIAVQPKQAFFHANLGEVCRAIGKNDAALRAYQKALKLEPQFLDAQVGLAEALFAAGQANAAVVAYEQAIGSAPEDASLWNNLGNALCATQRNVNAIAAYQHALTLDENNADAVENLARLLADQGQGALAVTTLKAWLEKNNSRTELQLLLAGLQARTWDRHGAIETLQALPSKIRTQPDVILQQGLLLEELGDAHAALKLYASAANDFNGKIRAALLARAGVCHEQHGDAEASARTYRQALEADPGCVAAWEGLQAIGEATDAEMNQLDARVRRGEFGREAQAQLHFLLGSWKEKAGEFDASFTHYANGNRAFSKIRKFDPQQFAALTDAIIETFSPAFFTNHPAGVSTAKGPIFIVGMPRSGTTLAERIIASHPKVSAGGERDEIRRLVGVIESLSGSRFPHCAANIEDGARQERVSDYQDWVDGLAPDGGMFTDKLPSNYLRLGIIALLFPHARIVHCRRDPRDTCLSCFTTHFMRGQGFSYHLDHLASMYQQYQRLMDHWKATLPIPMFELDYAGLVQDPETVGRELVEFCGLSWSPELMAFQGNAAPVRTASVWQVRRPIYTSSVERWRRFEGHLKPLIKQLKPLLATTS